MTVVTDPYSILAEALETIITTEFADEPYLIFRHDRLHESLGSDGRTYAAVSPDEDEARNIESVMNATIQFYGPFKTEVDPQQQVDPRLITNKAERLKRALEQARVSVASQYIWYFDVTRTRYPEDATGNKTRFEMHIQSRGNNTALIETTG